MKFKCDHRFGPISLADYENLYFDEDFNIALCKQVGLHRELVSREVKDGRIRRVVKVAPDREVPGPVAKVIGSTRLEYTETVDYVLGSGRGTWSTLSSVMTDKVDSRGSFSFTASGDGVVRSIEGDINVKITFIGGVVEKFIVDDVVKSYEKAAEFTRSWLAKK